MLRGAGVWPGRAKGALMRPLREGESLDMIFLFAANVDGVTVRGAV